MRVEGLNETLRALKKAGADAEDMKQLMFALGSIVVAAAQPKAPTLSGKMSSTIRAGKGRTKAVVRAGGAKAPYAGVIHYGWPARNVEPHPYLADAVTSETGRLLDTLEKGLADILRNANLV